VKEVMNGRPEDLLDKLVVEEGPKRQEDKGWLSNKIKIPG
jgi:hypothetical protein